MRYKTIKPIGDKKTAEEIDAVFEALESMKALWPKQMYFGDRPGDILRILGGEEEDQEEEEP